MDDNIILENRVDQFLDHLMHNERERKHLEHALLDRIVEQAKREGYDFTAEEFEQGVRVSISYGIHDIRWPPGRGL